MSQYLLIRRLQVRGANAISSPLTYGFPAVTAFLGFGHALQRHVTVDSAFQNFRVQSVGIISHEFEMLDHVDGFKRTLQLTANPLNSDGGRASFIEEGRCHLTVSLVLEVSGVPLAERDLERIQSIIVARMKLAGGDLVNRPVVQMMVDDRAAIRRLMPGYGLIERRELMIAAMQDGEDALGALHRHLKVQQRCTLDGEGNATWSFSRHSPGWLVPIATGYHALSPAGPAIAARDSDTPHRFAESLVTLGEFVIASRLTSIRELLWRYQHTGDQYACVQTPASIS